MTTASTEWEVHKWCLACSLLGIRHWTRSAIKRALGGRFTDLEIDLALSVLCERGKLEAWGKYYVRLV